MSTQQLPYRFCNESNVLEETTMTLNIGSCDLHYTSQVEDVMITVHRQLLTVSIPNAINESITANIRIKVVRTSNDTSLEGEWWDNVNILIPAGQTSATQYIQCYIHEIQNYDSDGMRGGETLKINGETWTKTIVTEIELLLQRRLPICGTAPTCDLEIIDSSTTDTSMRGVEDGQISVTISGATANTHIWSINGVNTFTGGTTQTFTELGAGLYSVFVDDGGDCYYAQNFTIIEGEFRTGDFTLRLPQNLAAVNNPVIYNIASKINSSIQSFSETKLSVISTVDNNTTITFNITYPLLYTAKFVAKGFPDKGNFFLASSLTDDQGQEVGSNSAAEIATSLAEVIQNDIVLSRLYDVKTDDEDLYLKAYKSNEKLDLSTNNITISDNTITTELINQGITRYDGELAEEYDLYVDLYVNPILQYGDTPDLNDFRYVGQIVLPFNDNNQHMFDVAQTLRNFVSTPSINFQASGATTLADMVAAYYVQYGEKYPLIANSATKKKRVKGQTAVRYVINSALDYVQNNNMSEFLTKPRRFLTNSPSQIYVQRDNQHYLSFILEASNLNRIEAIADIEFYNGTKMEDVSLFVVAEGNGTNFGGVYISAIGYDKLNIKELEQQGNTKIRSLDLAMYEVDDDPDTAVGYGRLYNYGNQQGTLNNSITSHKDWVVPEDQDYKMLFYNASGLNVVADWFLPSLGELSLMYNNLWAGHGGVPTVGDFSDAIYATSTQHSTLEYFSIYFNDGNVSFSPKTANVRSRPARKFISSTSYNIRDVGPAGGWIFSKTDAGGGEWEYYEAASEDTRATRWINQSDAFVADTSSDIGAGADNTTKIMAHPQHDFSIARLCSVYSQVASGDVSATIGNILKSCKQVNSPLGGACDIDVTGSTRWDENATHYGTDDFGFSMLPSGIRKVTTGAPFEDLGLKGYLWTRSWSDFNNGYIYIFKYDDGGIEQVHTDRKQGAAIRLVKYNTTLNEGETGEYVGNDGHTYPTICIGSGDAKQEWLSTNLVETRLRNGTTILNVADASVWLQGGNKYCNYDNDDDNVWLEAEDVTITQLTESKKFIYEIDEQPSKFGVAFLNKLGAWDTYEFVGEVIEDQNITWDETQAARQIMSDGRSPYGFIHNSVSNTRYTRLITVNTGLIDSDTYDWLQELLQSNRIYEYTTPAQNYLTVETHTSVKSSNDNLHTMQIQFRQTIHKNNVTV